MTPSQSNPSMTESMHTINTNILGLTSSVQKLIQLQQQSMSYGAVHGTTTSTTTARHNPLKNSIDNNMLPRCVATLPTTISMELPKLNARFFLLSQSMKFPSHAMKILNETQKKGYACALYLETQNFCGDKFLWNLFS